jgi:PAS domain S-box-containing protein
MGEPAVVLHVDDDDRRRDRVASVLSAVSEDVSTVGVDDVETGLSRVADGVDAVVCAYALPERDGLAFVDAVRGRDPDIPVVMLAAEGDERVASEAIRAGVTDYVPAGGEDDVRRAGRSVVEALDDVARRTENETGSGVGEGDRGPHRGQDHETSDARDDEASETGVGPAPALTSLVRAFEDGEDDRVRMPPLVEALGDPVYVVDDEGYLRLVNDAFVERFGYSRATLLDTHLSTFLDDDTYDRGTRALLETVDSDRRRHATFEFTGETADGTAMVAEVTATPLTDGGRFVGSVGTLRDVTERKERERELAQYETLMETVPVGMFTVDEDGVLTWINEECYELLDVDPAAFDDRYVGESYLKLVDDGFFDAGHVEEYLEYVREMLSSDTETRKGINDVRVHRQDGTDRIADAHSGLLPMEDGEFQGTVTAFRDVTKQKQYERELERQNERLERFASVISHDLRNPLTVAQGHLDVAKATDDPTDAIEEVGVSLDRMEELIDDVLALARQGQSVAEPAPVELTTVVAQAWNTVATTEATLRNDAVETVAADESRLRQLLENCFRNSLEHAGSNVTVTVGDLPDGFYVEDDGPGIPDDLKHQVFELGYTTEPDGTGFGLGIVSEIVDAHGWDVQIVDGDGGGARFDITGVETVEADPQNR